MSIYPCRAWIHPSIYPSIFQKENKKQKKGKYIYIRLSLQTSRYFRKNVRKKDITKLKYKCSWGNTFTFQETHRYVYNTYVYVYCIYKVRFEIKYFYKNVLLFNNWFFFFGGGAYSILNTPPPQTWNKYFFFLALFQSLLLVMWIIFAGVPVNTLYVHWTVMHVR